MTKQFINGYALLVGVNEYEQNSAWAMPTVARDVQELAKVLYAPQYCAYPKEQVQVLLGRDATRQGIIKGLAWLQDCLRKDDNATAIIYYSGHGCQELAGGVNEYYFIPYDVYPAEIGMSAVRAVDFAGAVNRLQPPRLLVMLDCCLAGGMDIKDLLRPPLGFVFTPAPANLFLPKAQAGDTKGIDPNTLAQGHGRATLYSSTGAQPSYLRKDRKMSVFTCHLIEALTGRAQPAVGDTQVTVSAVINYVHQRVQQTVASEYGAMQQPEAQLRGDFPIALLQGGLGWTKGMPVYDPVAGLPEVATAATTHVAFDQRGQTVYGSQTNINGNVTGPVFSGNFARGVTVQQANPPGGATKAD